MATADFTACLLSCAFFETDDILGDSNESDGRRNTVYEWAVLNFIGRKLDACESSARMARSLAGVKNNVLINARSPALDCNP